MARQEIRIPGTRAALAGLLELPARKPRAFALLAHCFPCIDESYAAARITRTISPCVNPMANSGSSSTPMTAACPMRSNV